MSKAKLACRIHGGDNCLVLGFAAVPEEAITQALARLRKAWRAD